METKRIKLQPRLRCIASCVAQGARLADVGTDHGYLPVYLLQQGRISHAIASDLRQEPLEHARRSALAYGIGSSQMELRLGSGLEPVSQDEADTIVIAGMGGELIAHILSRCPWIKRNGLQLILQPQTKTAELRTWLAENGFSFTFERLVRDKGILYVVIGAQAGESRTLTSAQAECGVLLAEDPLYAPYLDEQIAKLQKAISGLRSARELDSGEIARLSSLRQELEQSREKVQYGNCTGN